MRAPRTDAIDPEGFSSRLITGCGRLDIDRDGSGLMFSAPTQIDCICATLGLLGQAAVVQDGVSTARSDHRISCAVLQSRQEPVANRKKSLP